MFRPGSLAARLLALGTIVSFTGHCPVCDLVVPVGTDNTCARHWPHAGGRRFAYLSRRLPACRGTGRPAPVGYIDRVY